MEQGFCAGGAPPPCQGLCGGLHARGSSRTCVWAVFFSGFLLAAQVIPIWVLGRGLGLVFALAVSAVVLVISRVGTVLPEAPSNVGVFQLFAVLGLQLSGAKKGVAVGFATLLRLAEGRAGLA